MQALTTRLDSPRVVCDKKATAWDGPSAEWSSIISLNKHNVECPQGLFLASFQLKTEAYVGLFSKKLHRVSYHYHCCKFIL